VHAALVRRLVAAIQYMDETVQQQAILSLLENLETLAPVIPQVMLAVRACLEQLPSTFVAVVHAQLREIIRSGHYLAQIDLNLAYIVRALAVQHSTENEQLLIQLFEGPHGFGAGTAPNIQRDIMLILSRWGVTYWLSDQKNYIASAHPWVRRAFLIGSYTLRDEGEHWRNSAKAGFSDFDKIVHTWAADKRALPGWEVPV